MYLVDTDVLSRSDPSKADEDARAVRQWLDQASAYIFLSWVTIAEIEKGIARAVRIDASTKADKLRSWIDAITHLHSGRILPFDREAALIAGPIMDRARAHQPGFADVAIAATAKANDLTVLTANERHFRLLDVAIVNPFKKLPPFGTPTA